MIEVGQSHAIKNPFDEPLEFMALVINERGKRFKSAFPSPSKQEYDKMIELKLHVSG